MTRYRAHVEQDLVPALGRIPLDDLGYRHLKAFITTQLDHGRGKVTVHRIMATLSSALGDAVRHRRLAHNPAKPAIIPRPPAAERHLWTPDEAARFLRFTHTTDPLYADLVELLIGTGIRRGEALALRWDDVHLPERTLFVRATLSAVDNNHLQLTRPKTSGSRTWVALSDRVTDALQDRADTRAFGQATPASGYVFGQITPAAGYVFHRHGRPLHPKHVLDHFHMLCDWAGVRRIALHDLRHLTASFAMAAGVPRPVVSKTLRHRTLSTTANIYSALSPLAARAAVDAVAWALDTAEHTIIGSPACRALRPWHQTPRPHRRMTTPQPRRITEQATAWPKWPGDHHATTN
ncbi:integrase [Kitasatospora sp. MAA4]|nr:integrase [Kitasatospora sp. MAA4]